MRGERLSREIDGLCANASQYDPAVELLRGVSAPELRALQRRINRSVDELGLHFRETSDGDEFDPWRLDLFPIILTSDVWKRISAGVIQRALAFNAFATDIFQSQEILRSRVVPHDVVLRDPGFLRPLCGIEVPNGEYSQFGAFDLVEVQKDQWEVVEHHMGTPFGLSHALQNRRILSEVFPEIYESVDTAPIAGFSTHLLEMLRAQSDKINPHVLLLTAGNPGQAYFEEALLARHMGISVARPSDLIVRDSRVFLRTIRGLELIDVIYRRIESAFLDPITVPETGALGVPGLINVWRKGNVSIVNAPGVSVADNRALLRYDERIINYYLNEGTILPSVETYHLGDRDQHEYLSERLDQLQIKPVQDHDIVWRRCGGKRPRSKAALARIAAKFPEFFVAQEIPASVQLPHLHKGKFDAQGFFLRVYYILGKEPIVLPGGLARVRSDAVRTKRLTITTVGLKDVIVSGSVVDDSEPKRLPSSVGGRFSIGSRVAESLYWAGRYLERAENTARQLGTLERLRWDQLARSEQKTYWPLLQAVAAATGQSESGKDERPSADTFALLRRLVWDNEKGASVQACLESARFALESVSELVSPECREALEETSLYLKGFSKGPKARNQLQDICERIVSEVARFNGTAERTMLHDDAWQFYRIGGFFERGMGTLLLLEVALPKILESYRHRDEESADLTALLRLLGSLDAYRRNYRSRAYIDRVVELIFSANSNPSSLSFCLRNLHYTLKTLSISGERKMSESVTDAIKDLLSQVASISLLQGSPAEAFAISGGTGLPTPYQLKKELKRWTSSYESLHERIEDIYFTHQEEFAREPTLFDVG